MPMGSGQQGKPAQRTANTPIVAQFGVTCRGCAGPVHPGDSVRRTLRGWCHAEHFAQAVAQEVPGAARRDPAHAVACPRCGAAVDQSRVTVNGKRCPVHASRQRAAQAVDETS